MVHPIPDSRVYLQLTSNEVYLGNRIEYELCIIVKKINHLIKALGLLSHANKIQPLNILYDLINILYKTGGHICFNSASNDVVIRS